MSTTCRFVWHDLNTHDVEGAKRFYGELFHWSFEESGTGSYHHVSSGAQMIGGIRRKDTKEPGPPSWLGYVLVDAVSDTVAKVTAGGGQIYVATTVMPEVGTFAVVADPTGGVVAPWRSARPEENEEASVPAAAPTFCWDELLTRDPARATEFYRGVFDWGTETKSMGESGDYTLFTRHGATNPMHDDGSPAWAAGLTKAPPGVPHSYWLAYVQVDDVDASAEQARALGATINVPPTSLPMVGRVCSFMDPQGAALAVVSSPGS